MQYSPKLKKAMEEIKAIVDKYDIGACVMLHTPGFTEYLNKLDPSYSCVLYEMVEGERGIRFRARKQDYNGDIEKRNQVIKDTVNMLDSFCFTAGNICLNFGDILKMLEEKTEIIRTDGGHTSHTEQNN